jgi:hypothetical protein
VAESHSTYLIEPSATRSASLPKKKKPVKIRRRHPCFTPFYVVSRRFTSYVDVIDLERIAIAGTVWGDLFNRPDYGLVRLGYMRE